jgi:hypothetical protein
MTRSTDLPQMDWTRARGGLLPDASRYGYCGAIFHGRYALRNRGFGSGA